MKEYTSSGFEIEAETGKGAMHWGVYVHSETPTTGVVQNNHVEWLHEEIYSGIDLDCESCEYSDGDECMCCDMSNHTILIGAWKTDDDGLYIPDESGEYSAICGEIYTQVVWSKHTKRCALCSPCYPGQGDTDTPGEFLTYDLPPELYGNEED